HLLHDIEGVPEGHALGDRLVTSLTGGYSSALAISPRSMAFGAVAAGALLLVYLAIVSLAQAAARSS
ncbi:MAG: hypothetical protein QFC55_08505, partial [Chloroflexota bacterium]|nr:hypothetical protein [Chloroflexota bacterium]